MINFKTIFLGAAFAIATWMGSSLSDQSVQASEVSYTIARIQVVSIQRLPAQAQRTIRLINQGGPFPYRQDGTVFGNRERRLPPAARGTYREFTVPTPGASNRGARRIIAGRNVKYYTSDHYRSFRRVQE